VPPRAFKGEVQWELGAQLLALAEKQGAVVPLMIAHRIMGATLTSTGEFGRPNPPRSVACVLPSCRTSSAGDAIARRAKLVAARKCHVFAL
jgi:hypothetical protein